MKYLRLLSAFILAAACSSCANSTDPELDIEFTQINRGDLAFTEDLTFNEPLYQVLRSQEQLNDLYYGTPSSDSLVPPCEDCNIEPPPVVDFSVDTVLFVAHEIVGTGGYDILVTSVVSTVAGLRVNVLKTSPGGNCSVITAFTGPYRLYRIKGVFDQAEFVERAAVSSC